MTNLTCDSCDSIYEVELVGTQAFCWKCRLELWNVKWSVLPTIISEATPDEPEFDRINHGPFRHPTSADEPKTSRRKVITHPNGKPVTYAEVAKRFE